MSRKRVRMKESWAQGNPERRIHRPPRRTIYVNLQANAKCDFLYGRDRSAVLSQTWHATVAATSFGPPRAGGSAPPAGQHLALKPMQPGRQHPAAFLDLLRTDEPEPRILGKPLGPALQD